MFCYASFQVVGDAYVQSAVSLVKEDVCVAFVFHGLGKYKKRVGKNQGHKVILTLEPEAIGEGSSPAEGTVWSRYQD